MTAPFTFATEHEEFRRSVRRSMRTSFAASTLMRGKLETYPRDELRLLGELGLTGLLIDERDGGQGADPLTIGIACEEACYADMTVGYLVFASNVIGHLVAENCSEAVKEKWLPAVLAGDAVAALALTETECGSDAAAMRTRAEVVEGGYVLHGEKTSVTQAPHADFAVVFAQTEPGSGTRGVGAFLVPLDDPTVFRQAFDDPGFRPLGRGSITMDGTFVPDDYLVGEVGQAFQMVMSLFDLTRTLIGLMVTGGAQRALDITADYVTQRKAFGQAISQYQGVSFPIAEHTTLVEAVRILCYRSLGLRGAGLPHTREAAMIKWWGPEVAFDAVKDCIILHGQVGWSDEMPLQAIMRDISGYFIGDGTPQIQKLIIARDVLGRDAVGD